MEFAPEDLDIQPYRDCEISLTGNAVAELDLFKKHDRVYVSGCINFRLRVLCADCAEWFERDYSEKVYVEYQREPPLPMQRIHELGEDEMVRSSYSGDELNLLPLVRDTILLAVPIAPLCRPDCKGICPDCGANLNREECRCCADSLKPQAVSCKP